MKRNRAYSSLLSLLVLTVSVIGYTSCRQDTCHGITCLNGGTCYHMSCACPSGYSGANCENFIGSSLIYHNNTFTPVIITVNGQCDTVPVGDDVMYSGSIGAPVTGIATTQATYMGALAGRLLSWKIADVFPNTAQTKNINVPADYFYLSVINNSSYPITEVYVNYGHSSQTQDHITIPNNGAIYNIGYYPAFTNANLYLTAGPHYWSNNIDLNLIENQSYIYTAL